MDKDAILQYLQELNQELARLDVIGEVCLYGGAVMQVFAILEKYYPRHQVKPATQYFVEELFGQ